MKSDKSTSSTSVIAKQQKQTNITAGKSKLTQTNSAKKHQPQAKKKALASKPLVNGVSEPCKLAGSLTNGNLSDSNANHITKEERKKSETSESLAISSKGAKDVFAKYASTRYVLCFIL